MNKQVVTNFDLKEELYSIVRAIDKERLNGQWYTSITIHRGNVIELRIPWQLVPNFKCDFREYEMYGAIDALRSNFGPNYNFPEYYEFCIQFCGYLIIVLKDGKY